MRARFVSYTIFAIAIAVWAIASTAAQAMPPTDPTVDSMPVMIAPHSADINPLTASAEQLEQYGYPPRPADAEGFRQWQRMVSVPRRQPNAEKLRQWRQAVSILPQIYNTPAKGFRSQALPLKAQEANSITAALSLNWSGYAINDISSPPFNHDNAYVYAEWMVPTVQPAFGTCLGSWIYSSSWVGFDGLSSDDVLQGGIEADSLCTNGQPPIAFYSSWIEWYPFAEVRVSTPEVNPGDFMSVMVWYTTADPHGHVYLTNYTRQQAQSYSFDPPSGVTFAGDSAEWIVERPALGFTLTNLANYVAMSWNHDRAFDGTQLYRAGLLPTGSSATVFDIAMACTPTTWAPPSACPSTTTISSPTMPLYAIAAFWFFELGPAF